MTPKDLCTRLEAMAIRLDLDGDAECYLLQEAADLISTQDHAYVGSTQEIWDAINVDLQQIVDDVSCWQGQHTERVGENLSEVIARLNAAVSHERAGYEAAIAAGYAADKAAEERDALKQEVENLKPFAEVGMQMVQITTTVHGPDEWGVIPELWTMCMQERDEARAELAKFKAQKACATLHDDGHWTWNGTRPYEADFAGWRMPVYSAAGAGGPK